MGFPGGSVVKNPPANSGSAGDVGSIPGLERSPGVGNGSPLQYSCLENPMDRGAWQTTVHRVAKDQTRLSTHTKNTIDGADYKQQKFTVLRNHQRMPHNPPTPRLFNITFGLPCSSHSAVDIRDYIQSSRIQRLSGELSCAKVLAHVLKTHLALNFQE